MLKYDSAARPKKTILNCNFSGLSPIFAIPENQTQRLNDYEQIVLRGSGNGHYWPFVYSR
jgi:hypothetical protein